MKRRIGFFLFCLLVFSTYFLAAPAAVKARCIQSNCDGHVCQSYQQCLGSEEYGCDCVGNPPTATPKPTSGGGIDNGGGGGEGGATVTPRASVIPTKTLSPYETACGEGKCTNGWYCCM